MTVAEAKGYVGRNCWVSWTDRFGQEHTKLVQIEDLQFLPMYGAYLICNNEEVHLDKITQIRVVD